MKINRMIKIVCMILLIILFLNCFMNKVFASAETIIGYYNRSDTTDDGGGSTEVRTIIGRIISMVQIFGMFIAVVMLMSLGIKYMYASPGEKAQIKQGLTVYVIGAVVMFGSAVILEIIKNFYTSIT